MSAAPPRGPVASPCVNVCQMDAASGWCAGCLRSLDEIAAWSALSEAEKQRIVDGLPARRARWLVAGRALPEANGGARG